MNSNKAAGSQIRHGPHRDHVNQEITNRDDRKTHTKRKRRVAPRIFRFRRRDQRAFKAAEGEHERNKRIGVIGILIVGVLGILIVLVKAFIAPK